jgi:hypothetical protein
VLHITPLQTRALMPSTLYHHWLLQRNALQQYIDDLNDEIHGPRTQMDCTQIQKPLFKTLNLVRDTYQCDAGNFDMTPSNIFIQKTQIFDELGSNPRANGSSRRFAERRRYLQHE